MEINHFSHYHPLVLIKDFQGADEGQNVVCYGCKQPVVSGSITYCCSRCEVFLHKSCAELPLEITHSMHPEHPLKLYKNPPYFSSICSCNSCKRKWSGFTYNCSKCEFDVDVLCAQLETAFKHTGHHHPLKLQPRSVMFECDACGIEEKDQSYACTVCPFWIHKTCGSLPSNSSRKDHPHPLFLAYCLPEKYRHYKLNCDICRKKLHPSHWVYYCAPCRYFIHLKCMRFGLEDEEAAEANSNGVIELPVENVSSLLIRHFLEQNSIPKIELSTEINIFSHDHPLILDSVQDDYNEMTDDDQETVCDGCAEPISGTCYTCIDCKYFIHLDCAQLPKEISSSDHLKHKLSLSHCRREFFRLSECCKICKRHLNGFFYECKECDFLLDIKCALLPSTIKHEAHRHLLVRSKSLQLCNACMRYHGDVSLGCERCGFNLAIQCAMLPKIVRHRWDEHPLILSTPPFDYHPDEFICDMCEYEIHPKFWLYHCRKCDNSFHPRCIPRLGFEPYVKFGGTLQIDYHPHPLTFRRKPRYKSHCDKCGRYLRGYMVFECESCLLPLCRPCVCEIVDSDREVSSLEQDSDDSDE